MEFYNEPTNLESLNAVYVESDFKTFRIIEHEKDNKNIFIKIKNPIGNTLLDFTGAKDYEVYCYDKNGYLNSKHFALNNISSFIIQSPHKTILLMRYYVFNINTDCSRSMGNQINASLSEKIEILAENPIRFYVKSNVWVFRNSRQIILDNYLKEIDENKNYELYQRAIEVKRFLNIINNHQTESEYILLLQTEETLYEVNIKYYLKKEGDFLKLLHLMQGETEFTDTGEAIRIEETLNINDIMTLLQNSFKTQILYTGLPSFTIGGLINKKHFDIIKEKISFDREKHIKQAKYLRTPFIDYLEQIKLFPRPEGNASHTWLAKCPFARGNHFMMVSTLNDTYGCGWCKKKGNQKDLEQFISN